MQNYLIPEPFRSDNCYFITNTLVGLEVQSELWVVPLNHNLGGFLDGLSRKKNKLVYA